MVVDVPVPTPSFAVDLDGGDLAALEPLFAELQERPLDDPKALDQWLRDESELLSCFAAEQARRYIAMTCHSDDEASRQHYLQLEREVAPRIKVLKDELDKKLLQCPALDQIDGRYDLLLRRRRTARAIFRMENTALESRESELQTRQQELMGSLAVEFEGRQHTLQQMAPYLEQHDRDKRQRAYLASLEARRAVWPELEQLLGSLIDLRTQMGRNAGYDTYTPFRFQQLQRFDYDESLCASFHDAVAATVVPAVERLNEERRRRLGVSQLRPYDLDADLGDSPPLRPFATEPELTSLIDRVFAAVDPAFASEFDILRRNDLLDLMSRPGKAPGGYQYTLEDVRLPFIFANAVGTHRDVQTLLHEGGHAFHAILSRDEPLLDYRDAPIEFAETASMSMELMGLQEIEGVYSDEDAARARRSHFEGLLRVLPWIASIDAFQHWIYAHPDAAPQERRTHWIELRHRFAPGIDYDGLEDALEYQWANQTHLYNHPHYYIEYGIAQIAALQVWQRYRDDGGSAVAAYRHALSLGGGKSLPELFAAAGVEFDVSAEMLAALVADVERTIR